MTILDVGLLVGLLLQFSKASDLVLTNAQKEYIQRVCEDLSLTLEYTKPLSWFWRIYSERKYLSLFFALYVVFGQLLAQMFLDSDSLLNYSLVQAVYFALTAIAVEYAFGKRIANWLYGHCSTDKYIKRYFIILLGYLFLFSLAVLPVLFGHEQILSSQDTKPVLALLIWTALSIYAIPFFIFSSYWLVLVLTGYILLVTQLILLIL